MKMKNILVLVFFLAVEIQANGLVDKEMETIIPAEVMMMTANDRKSYKPIVQLSCSESDPIPSIIERDDSYPFSPFWLDNFQGQKPMEKIIKANQDENPSEVFQSVQLQQTPGNPLTSNNDRTSISSIWNDRFKIDVRSDSPVGKWFHNANELTTLGIKPETIGKKHDTIPKSGKMDQESWISLKKDGERTTAIPFPMKNKDVKTTEKKLVSILEERPHSSLPQSLHSEVEDYTFTTQDGVASEDSRIPGWQVFKSNPELRFVIKGNKLSIYSAKEESINENKNSKIRKHQSSDKFEQEFNLNYQNKGHKISTLDSLTSPSFTSSLFINPSSVPIGAPTPVRSPIIYDAGSTSSRPVPNQIPTEIRYASPTVETRSPLLSSAFPNLLKYQGSYFTQLQQSENDHKDYFLSSASLTYTIDSSPKASSQGVSDKSDMKLTTAQGMNITDKYNSALLDSLSSTNVYRGNILPMVTAPSSSNDHTSSMKSSISLGAKTSAAVLQCSSEHSKIMIYVLKDCIDAHKMKISKATRVLCLRKTSGDQFSSYNSEVDGATAKEMDKSKMGLMIKKRGSLDITPDDVPIHLATNKSENSKNGSKQLQKPFDTNNPTIKDDNHGHLAPSGIGTNKTISSDDEHLEKDPPLVLYDKRNRTGHTSLNRNKLPFDKSNGETDKNPELHEKTPRDTQIDVEENVDNDQRRMRKGGKSIPNQSVLVSKIVKNENLRRSSRDLGLTHYQLQGSSFTRAMPNVTAVLGEDVSLWCPVGGFPTPPITWRRDGQILASTIRHEMMTNGTLLIRNTGQSDVGQYSCSVSGRQGSQPASHTFLHVLRPPQIEPIHQNHELEEGARSQLSCAVSKGDLPMTINWLKDGRHLQHDPDVESKQISEFSTVLLFKSLQERHSGSYTCEAANIAATVNVTTNVRVKVSPKWVVEPTSANALVGSTVVLDCSARGYPMPVLTWLKASGETAQDFEQVVLDGVHISQSSNGSLVIMEIKPSDAGWFLCSATNSVGKPISKVVQLIINAPARVISEGGRITGHAGQTISVPCEATGDSPLTLTWLHHHTPVTPTHRISVRESGGGAGTIISSTLEIQEVTSTDAGSYTCRADNSHGHHTQIFTIAVIEPPTAPSEVSISEVGSRSALISWTLPQQAAITIQYKAAKEKSWVTHGRNVSVGQWTSSHQLSGLSPYKAYSVRLMAHNDLGVSLPSKMQVFTTLEEAPTGAPRDVQVTSKGPRSLLVKWRSPSPQLLHGPLRGYTLALRQQNIQGHVTYITRPAMLSPGNSAREEYEVQFLEPSSLYEVAVRAFTRAGAGPLSTPRIVQSTGHDAPSCSPTGVSCRGSGRGGIRVWWSPPPSHCTNAPVSGYTILVTPTTHLPSTRNGKNWEVTTTNLEKNLDGLPPAANISVRVKAFNEAGASPPNMPIFCITEDDVPGPPSGVRVIVTGATRVLVTWHPPKPSSGNIIHYTLYSSRDDQVAVRDVVGASGAEATWREVTGLVPGKRVQVWITATTVAGEGNASPRLTAVPSAMPKYAPVAVGGKLTWTVGYGAGVTLGCRGFGMPTPKITWAKGSSFPIINGQFTQLLPGGDLHLNGIRVSSNFTCWVKNSVGMDSITHQVLVTTTPMSPTITVSTATHDSLNLSITPAEDGGAPILGYTLHHRGRAGEWIENSVEPGQSVDVVLRRLSCGAPHHLYVTAWNSQGTSSPSPVLITNTKGKPPGRPEPSRLIEVNGTCVILRLYSWPVSGCPITHWKAELGNENERGNWIPLHSHVSPATTDLPLCDLSSTSWHLLRITASSTAGDTIAVYKVATADYNGGFVTAESIQEVVLGGALGVEGWLNAHVVAGVVSAILLSTAIIICICVIVRRRKYGGYSSQGESLDNKDGVEDDNARNSEITRSHLYSPTPIKKPRGSLASLKTQGDTTDTYEICPYATFSVDSSEGTLEYGLSLHDMNPRDCLDHPVHSDRHIHEPPAYGHTSRQRSQSNYNETEIAYISNNRGRSEYASRPKSISGPQPTSTSTPTPKTTEPEQEQRAWTEVSRKDTRGRPHRSRSRTRTEVTRRDSSTESNDASSPAQQRQYYQHPPNNQQHDPRQQLQQKLQQQQQQAQQQQQPQQSSTGRGRPHPLPPVRLVR